MEPVTLITTFATCAALATASPKWGCLDERAKRYPFTANPNPLDIVSRKVDSLGTLLATEIDFSTYIETTYSGYEAVKFELNAYLELADDWDGPGSKAPSAEPIATAIGFMDRLPSGIPLPKPMLSSSGEVGLYWDVDAIYADVAFEGGDAFSLFIRNRQTDVEIFVEKQLADTDMGELRTLLSSLA